MHLMKNVERRNEPFDGQEKFAKVGTNTGGSPSNIRYGSGRTRETVQEGRSPTDPVRYQRPKINAEVVPGSCLSFDSPSCVTDCQRNNHQKRLASRCKEEKWFSPLVNAQRGSSDLTIRENTAITTSKVFGLNQNGCTEDEPGIVGNDYYSCCGSELFVLL